VFWRRPGRRRPAASPHRPFVWTKTADAILASIARFAQRTLATQDQA
jgi:hypothetical protein